MRSPSTPVPPRFEERTLGASKSRQFGTALDRLERQATGDQSRLVGEPKVEAVAGGPVLMRKGREDEGGDERGTGDGLAVPLRHATTATAVAPASAPMGAPNGAEVERMAAAIAEHAAGDLRSQHATLVLPAGGVAEGAIVSRDQTGTLSIRLTGFDPRLGSLVVDGLRRDLAASLRERRIAIGDIRIERAERERPPR